MGQLFKKGDLVKCLNPGGNQLTQGKTYVVLEDQRTMGSDLTVESDSGRKYGFFSHRFVATAKTLESLQVGDAISDEDGDKRTVLAVLAPKLYALSDFNNPDSFGVIAMAENLTIDEYTIDGVVADDRKEMTFEDVEAALGYKIKITGEEA